MARKSDLQKTIREVILSEEKPPAPSQLTRNEAAVWDRIFLVIERGWIGPESYDLLIQYCRHITAADRVAAMITKFHEDMDEANSLNPESVKSMDRLMKMLDREVRASSSLATRLRLTNQSLRSDKSPKPTAIARPWETDE